nr:hypothetical protein [uncultured Roseateles sp.]
MRLSAYVRKHGIAAFNADDFDFVGSKLSLDPSRLILVGGQAIEVWGMYFDVLAPTGDKHPLTEDADWLGSQSDAKWLCGQLGYDTTELQLPSGDDHGPSTGLAFLERPDGRVLMMDFLRCIVGPSNEEVRRLAVPITVRGSVISVLHPLLCLKSRLANIALLPAKRRGNGPLQAEWSINIVAAYLARMQVNNAGKQLTRACHFVAESAEYKYARYCFLEFGIDPLKAVTDDLVTAIGGQFSTSDWPRTVARIEAKRAKWIARRRSL